MDTDLTDWRNQMAFARDAARHPRPPTADHVALLQSCYWDWNGDEFGAPSMDPKRPYGNSDVENDLAALLPHLSEHDRIRVHLELPGVLAWMCLTATEQAPPAPRDDT